MSNYIGLIHRDDDSDYGVSFPDFPGCVSAGVNLDEARAGAEEALALHIEGMIEDGDAIPEPTSLEDVMATRGTATAWPTLVKAPQFDQRSIRVNVTFPGGCAEADRQLCPGGRLYAFGFSRRCRQA